MLQQVFDLDSDIVSEIGKRPMYGFDESSRVRRAIKEIRITKRDMPRTQGHLATDVFEHYVPLYDTKRAIVDRHDRDSDGKGACSHAKPRCSRLSFIEPGPTCS